MIFTKILQKMIFKVDFIKNYNEESDEGYLLEFDVEYLKKLHELRHVLSFLPERLKIKEVEQIVANLHDKTVYVIHIRNLNQIWINLKKVHRVIKFNENAWLKANIDMNTDLRKKKQKMIEITEQQKKEGII